MSNLETAEQLAKGVDSFLSPEERLTVKRYLSKPEEFPPEFEAWILETVKQNGQPVNQQLGSRGFPRYIVSEKADATGFTATIETEIFSTTIPGRTISQGGIMTAFFPFTAACNDASNALTLKWKIGGVTVGTWLIDTEGLDSQQRPGMFSLEMRNLGEYGSQIITSVFSFQATFSTQAEYDLRLPLAFTFDTSQDLSLALTAKWTSAGGQSLVRKFFGVTVFNPIGV